MSPCWNVVVAVVVAVDKSALVVVSSNGVTWEDCGKRRETHAPPYSTTSLVHTALVVVDILALVVAVAYHRVTSMATEATRMMIMTGMDIPLPNVAVAAAVGVEEEVADDRISYRTVTWWMEDSDGTAAAAAADIVVVVVGHWMLCSWVSYQLFDSDWNTVVVVVVAVAVVNDTVRPKRCDV
jgi:hypothetical protein